MSEQKAQKITLCNMKEHLRPYPNNISGKKWAVFQGENVTVVFYELEPNNLEMKPKGPDGYEFSEPGFIHDHEHEQLIIQLQGKQVFNIGDETGVLTPFSLGIMPPQVPHGIGYGENPLTGAEDGKMYSMDIFIPARPSYYEAYLKCKS